jgi:hypothetical protein
VLIDSQKYWTTEEPVMLTPEAAQGLLDRTRGMIDEKVMLYQIGGYKVPGLSLCRRWPQAQYIDAQAIISAHALSRNIVTVALVPEQVK